MEIDLKSALQGESTQIVLRFYPIDLLRTMKRGVFLFKINTILHFLLRDEGNNPCTRQNLYYQYSISNSYLGYTVF